VQQIMTGLNEAVSEEEKLEPQQNCSETTHRPLKVVAFNANGITRQRYELSKRLQAGRIDMELLSETHLRSHDRFFIRYYHIERNNRCPGAKGGTAVAVRKGVQYS